MYRGMPSLLSGDVSPHISLCGMQRIPTYMLMNMLPFIFPFAVLYFRGWLYFIMTLAVLWTIAKLTSATPSNEALTAHHTSATSLSSATPQAIRQRQYLYSERNNQKYVSLRMVWPKSLHYPGDSPSSRDHKMHNRDHEMHNKITKCTTVGSIWRRAASGKGGRSQNTLRLRELLTPHHENHNHRVCVSCDRNSFRASAAHLLSSASWRRTAWVT